MVSRPICLCLVAVAAVAICHVGSNEAIAQSPGQAGCYYNYYTASDDGIAAQMYLCPRPVPARVGYTYITYQPLAPHEFMYRHSRTYLRRNENGRLTRTSVCWH